MKWKVSNRVFNWFCSTWLGGKYFELLLWIDSLQGSNDNIDVIFGSSSIRSNVKAYKAVLELKEIAYREGVSKIKYEINRLVKSKSTEEYHNVLKNIENLMDLAKETDPKKLELMKILRETSIFTGGKDIKTHTDRAKMVQKRIEDFKELHSHIESRKLMRDIRQAERNGNKELAESLLKQWREKYGKRRS